MEQYRETGEREGEAQNPTLHAKFSKKPSITKEAFQTFINGPKMWNGRISYKICDRKCGATSNYLYRAQIAQFFWFSETHLNSTKDISEWKRLCTSFHDTQRSNTLSLSNGAENIIGNFTQLSLDTKKYRTRGT